MLKVRHLILAVLLSFALPAAAAPSDAEKKQARALMEEGDAAVAKKDYARALEKYQAADAIMHVPTTGLEVARTLLAQGRLIEARDAALAVTRLEVNPNEPEPFVKARAEAHRLAGELAQRIPSLEVAVTGADAFELRIDGRLVPAAAARLPQRLDPGDHEVAVRSPTGKAATKMLTLADGQNEKLEIALAVATPSASRATAPTHDGGAAAPARTSPLVFVGFGVGAAGLLVGTVSGVLSLGKASDAKGQCEGNRCPPSAQNDIDASKSWATVSNVGFAVAVVGAGVGVWGLLSSNKGTERPTAARAEPVVGPRFVGVAGRF
ncbi:MAG: hypothetical protein HYZ29_25270 [Myxococcales bacterium]|nr:hypothetical protein [Myxococcales bacterium]